MQPLRKKQLLLVGITVAALAPFLNKAFHIDDPLFLWMAQQIAKHPLDPYGFSVNWASFPEPFWAQMQNPPLSSYYIAAVAALVGWSESALHFAFLFWPIMSILGTFALARRFCREPSAAALLTLFTPVFLVSSTNLMCDVMLLAFWVWAIELWLAGLAQDRHRYLLASAILIAAASLTKYFGVALVPLLAAYTLLQIWVERASRALSADVSSGASPELLRETRSNACETHALPRAMGRLAFLLIPLAAVTAYEFWTKSLYGRGLFTAAMFFARGASKTFGQAAPAQIFVGLAFTGGCLFAPLLHIPRKFLFAALGIFATSSLFYFLVPIDPQWALGANVTAVCWEGVLFAGIGLGIVGLAIVDLARNRDDQSLLLFIWLMGTFAFATFFNWSITARTILPMTPVAAILVVRQLELRRWAIVATALVSLLVATADYRQANTAREASRNFAQRFQSEPGKVWFQSHWGFQYYMQQWGATPLNSRDSEITSGDIMTIPANNTLTIAIPRDKVFAPEEVNFATMPFITTMGRGTGASFYSSIRGPIPWAIDRVPPEMYYVARFR